MHIEVLQGSTALSGKMKLYVQYADTSFKAHYLRGKHRLAGSKFQTSGIVPVTEA